MRSNKLIQIYATNLCNSGCATCTIWKNKEREELSLEQIKGIVEPFKDEADFVIGGGEALMHSEIEDILKWLYDNGVKYTLLSNCIMLERLKKLIIKYKVPSVTVSCDGVNHDCIRGVEGNLLKIKDFVKWAKDNDVNFKISYTYSAFNEQLFMLDMEYFDKIGVEKIYFCLAQNMELLHSSDNVIASDLNVLLERQDKFYDKDLQFIKALISGEKKKCDSQDSVFTIYSNGDVVRCQSFMSSDVIGNIKENMFADIVHLSRPIKCPYDDKCNLVCQRRYDYKVEEM